MKTITFLLLFIASIPVSAQETPTPKQAAAFLSAHINSEIDVTEEDKTYALLKGHKPGDIIIDGKNIYKIIEIATVTAYNAGYIYLDTNKLSAAEIKQLTDDILNQYNAGTPFIELAKKYTMDRNPKAGELKFIEGQMVAPFEKAVKDHATGEVFTVTTPEKGWFHIIKKNADNRTIKAIRTEYAAYKSS